MAFKVGLAGKCHCSIELERRERKEEKQKATIRSEKRYMLIAHSPLLGSALRLDSCKLIASPWTFWLLYHLYFLFTWLHTLKHCYQQDFACKHTKILLVDILVPGYRPHFTVRKPLNNISNGQMCTQGPQMYYTLFNAPTISERILQNVSNSSQIIQGS